MTVETSRARPTPWAAFVVALLALALAAPWSAAQPAPMPALPPAPVPVCVTFDPGDAQVFTPEEAAAVGGALARVAEGQCTERFLKSYRFEAAPAAVPDRPHLRVFLKEDGGWSLCASLTAKPVAEAVAAEWAVRIREAGEGLPSKAELASRLEREWVPLLFKSSVETMKARLRERAPVGRGGQIGPKPLAQVKDALASLPIEAARFARLRNLAFRIEGDCPNGTRVVLFSEPCDVGTNPDVTRFHVVQRDRNRQRVPLDAADVECLSNLIVGRIFLLDEPDPADE